MEQFYPKKDSNSTEKNGPSDLTIKRILAFSKAIKSHGKNHSSKEAKDSSKT